MMSTINESRLQDAKDLVLILQGVVLCLQATDAPLNNLVGIVDNARDMIQELVRYIEWDMDDKETVEVESC